MSININLEKVNYDAFVNKLLENPKINNRELLEKIILEFGNKIGEDLIVLKNEHYEDGICTWNMWNMITEVFNLEEDYVSDCYYEFRKDLIAYKEIDEAYENLGIERKIRGNQQLG